VLGPARDHVARAVEGEAAAVEDEIVLSPDLIHEGEGSRPPARGRAQHARPQVALLDRVGGGGHVDDELGPRRDERLHGVAAIEAARPEVSVVPDVLADRDAEAPAAERHDADLA
jgi:hypothetical protein